MNRRTFIKQAAVTTGAASVASVVGANESRPGPQATAQEDTGHKSAMKPIEHLLLFIHTPVTYSYHKLLRPAPEIAANYRRILASKASEATTAACIIQSHRGDQPLVEAGQEHFGDRCIVDPSDNSDATKVLLIGDLERALGERGNHGEWNIYELWSSNNARRWVEGLKKELATRGFAFDPDALSMETFGSWSGCHHKYSNFMAAYLGMERPATLHAETDLCTHKGFPMDVAEFIECVPLDRDVLLFLFRRTDGCPMAQFWDGRRPVWERPHTATVTIDPRKVELFNFSPNSLIQVEGACRKLTDGFVADVGDGCHPAFTTVVGRTAGDTDLEAFRTAMANAVIAAREGPPGVSYAIEV